MPGIVTHSRVLKESITLLSKREKKSYLLRSLQALFATQENVTAGLFGSIGPNIFDYIPKPDKHRRYGSPLSFFLHDGGINKLLTTMIKTILDYPDKNTEWAALQRSYLYGMISHIVTDSIFHPFVLYYSGFPSGTSAKEINYFREQNLLFQYNIDNFFQYHDEHSKEYPFRLDEMLPVRNRLTMPLLKSSIKTYVLDSVKNSYPDIYQSILIVHRDRPGSGAPLCYIDLVPFLIKTAYRLKKSDNTRIADFFRFLRRNNLLYSDFIVRYPMNKRYNKNILNLHRERWEHPAGKPGLHYESIHNLLSLSCEKSIELWEKIESSIYTKGTVNVNDFITFNAFTGDVKLKYENLKIKNPVRLSY